MIHHLSIAAVDPHHVAQVLAELLDGGCVPFPLTPGAYLAYAPDGNGTGIEVLPAATVMQPDGAQGAKYADLPVRSEFSPTHFALSVECSVEDVARIAQREGWQSQRCSRGPDFEVIELWIENHLLVELLPPALAARYLNFTAAFAAAPQSLDSHAKQ